MQSCVLFILFLYTWRERASQWDQSLSCLLLVFIPHLPVSSSAVARWLKKVISDSDIDTSVFKAHSIRSGAAFGHANQGVTLEDILKAADWSTETSFQRFFYKPIRNTKLAVTVTLSATNNTIDTCM